MLFFFFSFYFEVLGERRLSQLITKHVQYLVRKEIPTIVNTKQNNTKTTTTKQNNEIGR